jgi:hypothetical protein
MAWWHGACYVTEFGEDRLLKLPHSHTDGLALYDIGPTLMRRLLDAHTKPVPQKGLADSDGGV